jgi:tetratricopeptide (TPR) repeat protein
VTSGAPTAQPDVFPDSTSPNLFTSVYASAPTAGDLSGEVGRMIDAEACNTWTESGVHSPTVSAKRLEIPGRAVGEYQKGCGALKGKRVLEAEDHLRKAIDLYPDYAAAWVVLGQVLVQEKKDDDAKTACSKAEEVDPGYVASYLCLAEFAAGTSNWPAVSDLSQKALAIDPIGNPYSLYYAADAGLHQNQLSQAEMHAQAAVKLDEWHHLPELHLLLAQIYEAAGNVVGETTQLKEFLKVASNSKDAPKAKKMLAELLTASAATAITVPGVKNAPASEVPAK